MTDRRVTDLTPWQREVYDLCMACGIRGDRAAGAKLDAMKKEDPVLYEKAYGVWEEVMAEILYD